MNRTRIILTVQSVLCVLLAVLLAAAALGNYTQGRAAKAEDPLSPVYTREKVAAALVPVWPLLAAGLVLTAVGLALGIRDKNAETPAKDPGTLLDLAEKNTRPVRKARLLRAALLILAVVLILAGVLNGSARDVFNKAVRICTECVGLG